MTRKLAIGGVTAVHPGRGVASRIEMFVIHEDLKGRPGTIVELPEDDALRLIAQLSAAIIAVRRK